MAYNEGVIRDFLAKDLNLIEVGLELIDTEYHLPNNVGSKGFIDILARDKHGLIVVIELKRSDAAARQCIHELFKYTGLLAQNHGIRLDQVRCIAVSTDWHELLLPFSELSNSSTFQLTGFKLTVDINGRPLAASKVQPLPAQLGVELCPEYTVFLYGNNQRRTDDLERMQKNFDLIDITDYVLIELNHVKNDPRVLFPFGLLVALPSMRFVDANQLHPSIQDRIDYDCRYPVEMAISVAIQDGLDFDAIEISYPDKFINTTADRQWRVGRWFNSGTLQISPLRGKESVLAEIAGLDSGLGTSFSKTLSPDNHIAWARFLGNLARHVMWCEGWKPGLFEFLEKMKNKGSSVSVHIYAPDDMMTVLHKMFIEGDPSYLPLMEVIASSDSGITDILIGYLEWTGKTITASIDEFITKNYEDFEGFIYARHSGEQSEFEGATCEVFEVSYAVSTLGDYESGVVSPIDLAAYRLANDRALQELSNAFSSYPTIEV